MISTGFQWHLQNKRENIVSWIRLPPSKRIQLKNSLYFWVLLISLCWTFLKSVQDPLPPMPEENTSFCIYFHTVDCILVFGQSRNVQMNRGGAGWLTEATSANCITTSKFYLYYCFCLSDCSLIQVNKCFQLSGCALQAFIRCTAFSLSQIQQFKVNPMVNQDQKWSLQDIISVADEQFSVYSGEFYLCWRVKQLQYWKKNLPED